MAYTPLSTTDFLAVKPISSSPSTSPVFTVHRVVKDAADSGDITVRGVGMNLAGYKSGIVRVVPSVSANPDIEIQFWSEEAGKFISAVPAITATGIGAGKGYSLNFLAFSGIVLVKVTGGVSSGDSVTILMAGAERNSIEVAAWAGPLLFSDGNFTNASARNLIDPITPQMLGPFAGGVPATVDIGSPSKKYGQFEEARTNLQPRSQELDNQVVWARALIGVTPNDANDPLGNATADKLIPTIADDTHYIISTSASVTSGTTYTFSFVAKDDGYDWILLHAFTNFVANSYAYFNVKNGTVGTVGAGNPTTHIVDIGGGYYRCSITALANGTGATALAIYVANDDNSPTFPGDGSSGVHGWGAQLEAGAYPSSYIVTEASSVTRNYDRLYWAAADVPAAMKSGRWAFKWIPEHSSTESALNEWMLSHSGSSGVFYSSANDDVRVWDGGLVVASNTLTFARGTHMTVIVDASAGTLEVIGADAGDGEKSGTPWDWSDEVGNWAYGAKGPTSISEFINGLLSEPYAP